MTIQYKLSIDNHIALTAAELNYLNHFLKAGDRGGFYVAYYNMVRSSQSTLQAKIATFSDNVGGLAYASNAILQYANPIDYRGIYKISQRVAENAYAYVAYNADNERPAPLGIPEKEIETNGSGYITENHFFDTAEGAWESFGIRQLFPGNLLNGLPFDAGFDGNQALSHVGALIIDLFKINASGFVRPSYLEVADRLFSDGIFVSLLAASGNSSVSAVFGKEIADYQDDAAYAQYNTPDGQFKVTIKNSNNKVVAVNDRTPRFNTLGEFIIEAFAYIQNIGPVSDILSKYFENYRKSLTEAPSPDTFDGDINPRETNDGTFIAPTHKISKGGTSQNDTLWATTGGGTINAKSGNDAVFGGRSVDKLNGDAGEDLLWGGAGGDELNGGAGNDILRGGAGNDTLKGSAGNDILDGGDIKLTKEEDGKDTADYSEYTTEIELGLDNRQKKDIEAGIYFVAKDGGKETDVLRSIERVRLQNEVADEITLSPENIDSIELEIDGGTDPEKGTKQEGARDILNLEAFTDGIGYALGRLRNAENPNVVYAEDLHLRNFEDIRFGSGNDFFQGDVDGQRAFLGAGDDVVAWAGLGTQISLGAGKDRVLIGDSFLITDATAGDELYARNPNNSNSNAYKLSGGTKHSALDTPWVTGRYNVKFALSKDNELIVENSLQQKTYLANANVDIYATSPTAGIRLGEYDFEAYRVKDESPPKGWLESSLKGLFARYKAWTGEDFSLTNWDPLVLDLDDDGIELTALTSVSPRFDLDGDRFAEETGWVQRDDAFLVLDKNGNGSIDDINELFGIGLTSGFTELSALDSNNDGWFSDKDDRFNEVQLWQDKNQNALSEADELTGLSAAGIQRISLNATAVTDLDIANNAGNLVAATARYQRTDGSTGTVADVRFMVDNYNSTYLTNTTVSAKAAALPEIKGYGVLPNLRIAMSESPSLLETVKDVLPSLDSPDMRVLRQQAFPIFAAWGGAQVNPAGQPFGGDRPNVPVFTQLNNDAEEEVLDFALQNEDGTWRLASRKPVVDQDGNEIEEPSYDDILAMAIPENGKWEVISGAELAFMERYFGELIPLSSASEDDYEAMQAVGSFLTTMQERLDVLALRLAVQGPLAKNFPGIAYDAVEDIFVPTTERQLTPMFEVLLKNAPASADAIRPYLEDWQEIIRLFIGNYDRQTDGARNTYSFIVANLVAAYENVGLATSLTGAAEALGVPENFVIESSAATVEGTAEKDIFYINSASQDVTRTFNGGLEHDAYVVGRNFGNVIIADVEGAGEVKSPDIIRFAQLRSTDVEFNRDGIDLLVTDKSTGDQLRVKEQFEGKLPGFNGGGDLGKDMTIQEISFADGVSLDFIDISRRIPKPSAAHTVETGTAEIDFFDGGAGYDSYFDVEGGDVYIFGKGYEHDIINEAMSNAKVNSLDYVQFKPDISLQDVRFELEHGTDDLHIYAGETGDILTLRGQYERTETGSFGAFWFNQVELFSFDDGTLDADTILKQVLNTRATDGDDRLTGSDISDVLDGRLGNDYLAGGNGDDTYIFGKNYGFDYIDDTPTTIAVSSSDTILFGANVSPADVTLRRVYNDSGGYDLLVGFIDDNSQLYVKNQLSQNILGSNFHRIETFQFQDDAATAWTWQEVQRRVLREETVDDKAVQFGTQSADILSGSNNNDIFHGGDQSDVYRFGRGSGVDIIQDKGNPATGNDNIVQFTTGVLPKDVEFSYGPGKRDLIVDITDTRDRLIIKNGLTNTRGVDDITAFHFENDIIMSMADIESQLATVGVPASNEVIVGHNEGAVLDGGEGNDLLEGKGKIDTYVFGYGYGADVIDERKNSGIIDEANVLRFTDNVKPEDVLLKRDAGHSYYKALNVYLKGSNDLLRIEDQFTTYQNSIHKFEFADGTTWSKEEVKDRLLQPTAGNDTLIGFYRADTLTGGAGQDYLSGRYGSDIYEYNLGDGADIIEDSGYSSDENIIRFGAGITPETTTLHRSSNHTDFYITFDNNQDRLTVIDAFSLKSPGYYGNSTIDWLEFDDGTRWGEADLEERLIQHTAGDDYIVGFAGEDILHGGKGNDYLSGRGSNDTYHFNLGDGHDVIADYNYSSPGTEDILSFGTGINPNTLFLRREGDDLIINIKGKSDWLTVRDQFNSSYGQIEKFSFANGDTFTLDELQELVDNAQATVPTEESGNAIRGDANDNILKGTADRDLMHGEAGNDKLIGRNGDDALFGGEGNDRLIGGDGDDRLLGGNGNDRLVGNDGDDILIGEDGRDRLLGGNDNDQLVGGGEKDFLIGQAGDDILSGEEGNDILQGGGGSDTFILGKGMGTDTIRDFQIGIDSIGLTDGLSFGDLSLNNRRKGLLIQFEDEVIAVVKNISELDANSFVSL